MAPVLLARVDETIYSLAILLWALCETALYLVSPCGLVVCGPCETALSLVSPCRLVMCGPCHSDDVQGGDQGPVPSRPTLSLGQKTISFLASCPT